MRMFLRIFFMELKLQLKAPWVYLVIVTLGLYLIQGYNVFVVMQGDCVLKMLSASAYIVMAGTLLGMIAGSMSACREENNNFSEVFLSLQGSQCYSFAKISALCMVVLIVVLVSSLELIVLYQISAIKTLHFYQMLYKYLLLYWGIPTFAGVMIGYSLKRILSSLWAYPLMFVIWLIVTPFNVNFLPHAMSIFLNMGNEIVESTYDYFSGLNINIYTYRKQLFILFSVLFIFCIVVFLKDRLWIYSKIRICVISLLLVSFLISFLCFPLEYSEKNISVYKLSNMQPEKYYTHFQEGLNYSSSDLDIHKYYINNFEHINYEVKYNISIFGSNRKKLNQEHFFTLYHEFKVNNLTLNNKDVEYSRNGDFIQINIPVNTEKFELNMDITCVSTKRSIITPTSFCFMSSFPWYPVPGKKKIFEVDNTTISGMNYYKNVYLENSVDFEVSFIDGKNFFSNLDQVSPTHFKGNDKGITLVCGNIVKKHLEGKSIVGPLEFVDTTCELIPLIEKEVEIIRKNLNLSAKDFPKKVFIVPLYSGILNTFPVESSENEIFIDSKKYSDFLKQKEKYFTSSNVLFPALFWMNTYRESDKNLTRFLPIFYMDIFEYRFMETNKLNEIYSDSPYVKNITKFLVNGEYEKLQEIFVRWYPQGNMGNWGLEELSNLVTKD